MEQTKPMSHTVAGLLIAAAVIVVSIILNFIGKAGGSFGTLLPYIIIIAGLIILIGQYAKAVNYTATFGNLFSYGFKTTTVIIIIFIGFLILFNLIFPEFREKTMDMARQRLEEQGNFSEDQINQSVAILRKNFWPFTIGATMLGFAVIGAIGSLIGASVAKKRP